MALTSAERTVGEIGAALVVAVGALVGYTAHERAIGARDLLLHAADSASTVQRNAARLASNAAVEAASVAQVTKMQAMQQLAHSAALRRVADSVAHTASLERDSARRLLADSVASLGEYRSEIIRLVEAGTRDSAASRQSRDGYESNTRTLVAALSADSVALRAAQTHAHALQALSDTQTREAGLLKAQQPGLLARHVALSVGYGVVDHAGVVYAGPTVAIGWKVWP